jgi:diguanylate cyclase (GGDEF)-like protein
LTRPVHLGSAISRWWRHPDQFEWLSGYLHARGLATPTRRMMALVSAALVGMPLGLLRPPYPHPALAVAITVGAAAVGAGYAVLWLRGWPSRIQSLTMIGCGGLVAVASILMAEPAVAVVSCSGLVVLCGYLAFFHSVRDVLCSIVIAIGLAAVCAFRTAETMPGSQLAVVGFWVAVEVCVAVPIAILAVVRTLGTDVVRSDHDALTGVLNRRAFYERAVSLLTSHSSDSRLVVVMIDLDKFKHLNDTYGHVAGDQALTAVGWALRQANTSTAIIGRAGGEEFVVVDCLAADKAEALPGRLCAAIAALPHAVTASVGAAIVPFLAVTDPAVTIGELIRAADAAMYRAKRDGGNRVAMEVSDRR